MPRTEPTATRASISPSYQGRDPEAARPTTLLPWPSAEKRLRAARTYWVVTVDADGWPHPRPLWGLWDEGGFSFSVLGSTRIARNLGTNPRAAIHLEDGENVLAVDGTVETVPEGELPALLERWYAKYAGSDARADQPPDADRLVYRLRPRRAHGWTLAAFPSDLTRWTFPSDRRPTPSTG